MKRDGKKKNRFISRFPYFAANHGRIWISGTDLWHLHKGLDFVLTAMFTAIFADNWLREKDHTSSISDQGSLHLSTSCI